MRYLAICCALFGSSIGVAWAQFDGAPSAPLPISSSSEFANWDVQVHSRDQSTWDRLESMQAEHGPNCSGPPATHETHTYEGAVYVCNNHVMTALNTSGYGVIYLTPNQLMNFENGIATVQWEMSTQRNSTRDWPDIWVTPWADNLALPFNMGDVDLQGVPRRGVHVSFETNEGAPRVGTISDFRERTYNNGWDTPPLHQAIAALTNQAAVRQTFKLTLSEGHIRFERLGSLTAPAVTFFDQDVDDFPMEPSVVQFGHHSYTPFKDGAGTPGTWHWDNMTFGSSTAFTMIKSASRYVTHGQTAHFPTPAPNGARLRFSAIGSTQLSFNGGSTWQTAPKQTYLGHPEHFSSYWVPVPAGTTQVSFRFSRDDWYQGPFRAKDISIWSQEEPAETSPSATPTQTRTPTRTPTRTATARPSGNTATATLTASRTATATRTRTPTSTSTLPLGKQPPAASPGNHTPTLTPTATRTPTPNPIRRIRNPGWRF